jgi:hypothetical protein
LLHLFLSGVVGVIWDCQMLWVGAGRACPEKPIVLRSNMLRHTLYDGAVQVWVGGTFDVFDVAIGG